MKNTLNIFIRAWFVSTAFLFYMPNESLGASTQINDKIGHFLVFASLGFLFKLRFQKILWPLIIGILYGIVVEIIQLALPAGFHRGAEWQDIVADTLGVISGVYAAKCILVWLNKR